MHCRTRCHVHLIATPVLVLSALLAGCGGASDKSPATNPPTTVPPGPIGVSFTSPVAANNVYDVNTAIPLQVTVTVNGNPAANGTPVTLTTTSSASLAPVAPTTAGGAATSTLTSAITGPLVVNATVTSTSNTANESLKLYIRPAHQPLELLVPAYFSSTGTDSPWTTLLAGGNSYPNVKITAIANPNSGVLTATTTANTDLVTAITNFKSANRKVIGYVSTLYGNGARSEADVKTTIDKYIELYPGLEGFFIDEMASGSNRLAHYETIYSYIKSKNAAFVVIGNPGIFPDPAYASAADALVTFEGTAAGYLALDPQQSSNTWVYSKANTAQAMLAHSADTCTAMQDTIKYANQARLNTGLVFATDQTTSHSADKLPSYWTKLLGTVDALNAGRTLPAC